MNGGKRAWLLVGLANTQSKGNALRAKKVAFLFDVTRFFSIPIGQSSKTLSIKGIFLAGKRLTGFGVK